MKMPRTRVRRRRRTVKRTRKRGEKREREMERDVTTDAPVHLFALHSDKYTHTECDIILTLAPHPQIETRAR